MAAPYVAVAAVLDRSMRDVLKSIRWAPLITGALLIVIAAAIGRFQGYQVRFGGPVVPGPDLAYISPGEFLLWLSYFLLLSPGCMLAAFGLGDRFSSLLATGVRDIQVLSPRGLTWLAAALALLVWPVYRLLRWSILRDHHFTDDEPMIRFGAQVWTSGHLMAEKIWPPGSISELFTLTSNGRIASMDWPGGLAIAALSLVTDLGPWLYGLFAAAGVFAISVAGLTLAGKRGALLAAAIWLACPMVWTLAITQHTHIVSRTLIAFAFLACAKLWRDPSPGEQTGSRPESQTGWAILLGLCAGYSTATRPYETMSMLGPACVYLAWLGLSQRGVRLRQACVVLAAALPSLLAYGAYNYALTGSPFLTPREVPWAADADLVRLSVSQRAGQNLGHNLLMLGVWFFGALGLPLAWCGFTWRGLPHRALRTVLGLGIAMQLCIALGHENVGIHVVGPIHYSETVVSLTLLSTLGVLALADWCKRISAHPAPLLASGFGYLVSVLVFGGIYTGSLQGLGRISDMLPAAVRAAGIHNAIVMAQMPCWFERTVPGSHGSWQLAHAPPDPKVTVDVFYVNPDAPMVQLMRAFPGRSIYHAWLNPKTRKVEVGLLFAGPTNPNMFARIDPAALNTPNAAGPPLDDVDPDQADHDDLEAEQNDASAAAPPSATPPSATSPSATSPSEQTP